MNVITAQRIPAEDAEGTPRFSRRHLLGGIGAGGLAAAATVFGFATPASATVKYGCCHLCCKPNGHTLAQCENGFHYVWTCAKSGGGHCTCCEHESPCSKGCHSTHYSFGRCT